MNEYNTRPKRKEGRHEKLSGVYWIKKNNREYLNHMFVTANNVKEACKVCKQQVKEQTGRNAFRPATKAPDLSEYKGNHNFVVD